ncbi:8d221f3b-15d5-4f29-ba50-02ddc933663e [Sclerotinia trifoliorum]|uniref:Mediator of RNA polymerase II transcription subunit 13 n=1 Tax=Sclerotinia trifoliorum TaxID=28548 RepID=A0A8H2W2C3_9HELO|nr:8d221f3b-15d5-4f29-ba50-02ddc933663e [Sclerotinia trifoliorum]
MDLGDQLTNVLSCNNFASIAYEYFEAQSQTPSFTTTKKHLQDVETAWRRHGALVYYDTKREGIWVFQPSPNSPNKPLEGDELLSQVNLPAVHGVELLKKDKGVYEPSNLAPNKSIMATSLNTPTSTSSPSPLDNTIRNAQSVNARAMQANSAQNIFDPAASSPGVKSTTGSADALPFLKEVQEHFISSVQGSILHRLCSDHGFIPLNSRTLLFPSQSPSRSMAYYQSPKVSDNAVTLVNLDISLTSLGTLLIKACSYVTPGLQSISLSNPEKLQGILSQGTELWLAPGGNPARFYSFYDDEQLPSIQPISDLQKYPEDHSWRFHGTTIKSWQSRCLDWLSTKGFDPTSIEEGGWMFVQVLNTNHVFSNPEYADTPFPDDGAIVPWPALLCFRAIKTSSADLQPSSADSFGSVDPLTFAEEWSMNAEKQASIILNRQQERKILEAAKEQADREAQNIQANVNSTALMEKGNNAGAMYPTPPDAVHHPGGPTPSFDGAVTTPGNPAHLFSHDLEAANPSTSIMTTIDTEHWVTSEQKHRSNSNMNFSENDNDNDNLFGEMGGDLFGDTDITDADFNFFDQPDDMQMDPQPGSPVAPYLPPAHQRKIIEKSPILSKPSVPQAVSQDTIMEDAQPVENSLLQPALKQSLAMPAKDMDIEMSNTSDSLVFPAPPRSPPSIMAPFDKETVFGQLVKRTSKLAGGSSVFDKVKFEYSLAEIDEKYGSNGRFRYTEDELKPQLTDPHDPTNPESLDRRKSENKHSGSEVLTQILNNDSGQYEFELDNGVESDIANDFNSVSDASDSDETLPVGLSAMVRLGMKRKRYFDEGSISSYNAFTGEYEPSPATPQSIVEPQVPIFESDPADWSLTPYFTSPEPDIQPSGLSDQDLIETAQIIADQAASGNLRVHDQSSQNADTHGHAIFATRRLMTAVLKATKSCLKDVKKCTLRSYLTIPGIPVVNPALRLPPRPMPNPRAAQNTDLLRSSNLFPIQPPQLEVRRGDSKLAVLPPAIHFWDNLGLAPFTGNKDVNAICIHPDIVGITENADIFLDQMRGAYESFRFGGHDRIVFPDSSKGLIHYPFDEYNQGIVNTNTVACLSSLKDIMAQLSKNLSSMTAEEKNIVVYFVYPVDNSFLLVNICAAFKYLFKFYRKYLSEKKLKAVNELVLQLVPLDFMAAPNSLVVPSPAEYSRLAMEVYDRCVDFASSSTTAAILLEKPLPRNIDFKLHVNPSPALLQENSCLHIAYSQSIDERWITAAWSDNRGTKQMTASYCLGRKSEPFTLFFTDIANEIWETTLDLISSKKVHWRIIIAKTAVMEQSEIDFWTGLASTESNASISLTLVTVQTDPSLRILPPQTRIPPPSMTTTQSATTPVSTPQASQSSIFSPDNPSTPSRDPTTNAPTPSEAPAVPHEPDQNSRLLDITDQTWGAVLSHRLNNSNSLLEFNPALISGYLIKNSGTNTDDPPLVMEVNIIHAEVVGNPRTFHDTLLREILGYYRGLATLARVRGVVHPVRDGRPWHVAAAEKAVKALYMLV